MEILMINLNKSTIKIQNAALIEIYQKKPTKLECKSRENNGNTKIIKKTSSLISSFETLCL